MNQGLNKQPFWLPFNIILTSVDFYCYCRNYFLHSLTFLTSLLQHKDSHSFLLRKSKIKATENDCVFGNIKEEDL